MSTITTATAARLNSTLNLTDTTVLNSANSTTTAPHVGTSNYVTVGLIWSLIALGVLSLVYRYANKKTPWYVLIPVAIGWVFPFSIVFLLPVDLSSAMYIHCSTANCAEPLLYVDSDFLLVAWRTIYWTMFNLTFFVIPILQAYVDNGYFSPVERFKKALRRNVIYYICLALVGLVVLAAVAVKKGLRNVGDILGFAMAGANIFGLSIVVVLLAYGLVELPKHLWHISDRRRSLKYLEFRAPKVRQDLNDIETVMHDLETELLAISQRVRFHDELRPYVDQVLKTCALTETDSARASGEASPEYAELNLVKLAKLHKDILRGLRRKEQVEWEWNNLCENAFHLQDIINNQNNPEMKFKSSLMRPRDGRFKEFVLLLSWIWFVRLEHNIYRLLSIFAAVLSIIIVWSETVYAIPGPELSIIALIFRSNGVDYATVEILSVIFMLYMCFCSVFSLFRVRVFDMFSLHPNHKTSEISLCWFTSYMCRLTFPLCYNFINMANTTDSVFSKLMGIMNLAPIIGDGFQIYVPILIVVICLLNLLNVVGRLAKLFGFSDDLFSGNDGGKENSWGDVDDGRIMLTEARSEAEKKMGTRASSLTDLRAPARITQAEPSSYTDRSSGENVSLLAKEDVSLSKYKQSNPLYQKYQQKQAERRLRESGNS